ncbi:6194_t:CDS:2, partial [Racocetra fulgida]
MPLDQPMDMHEYIIADNDLITTEILTDEEIIEAVKNQDCIEPEDEVEDSLIHDLGKLKKEVHLKNIASKKQATLDSFIQI